MPGSASINAYIYVDSNFRREKIGATLLEKLKEEAKIKNYKSLKFETFANIESGKCFMEFIDANLGQITQENILQIDQTDKDMISSWLELGNKEGFTSGIWHNELPENEIEEFVKCVNAINDAPTGNLGSNIYNFTKDNLIDYFEYNTKMGLDFVISYIKDQKTGDLKYLIQNLQN